MKPPEFVCQSDQEFFRSLYETQQKLKSERTKNGSEDQRDSIDEEVSLLQKSILRFYSFTVTLSRKSP